MDPKTTAAHLRRIASYIDSEKHPSRNKVVGALRGLLKTADTKLYHALDPVTWQMVQQAGELRVTGSKSGAIFGPGLYFTDDRALAERYVREKGSVLLEVSMSDLQQAGGDDFAFYPAGTMRGRHAIRSGHAVVGKNLPLDIFSVTNL